MDTSTLVLRRVAKNGWNLSLAKRREVVGRYQRWTLLHIKQWFLQLDEAIPNLMFAWGFYLVYDLSCDTFYLLTMLSSGNVKSMEYPAKL